MKRYRTTLIQSFGFAFKGIIYCYKGERNIWIQSIIGIIAIVLGAVLKISLIELIIIITMVFLVVILEMFNTGFERLIDVISPKYHKEYGKIKDIIAGVVLMNSILAIIVGILIFTKHIFKLFGIA